MCSQRIDQLLKLLRLTASQECVGTLLKIDGFFAHLISQPVVLDSDRPVLKRANKGTSVRTFAAALIINIKVVLDDPALSQLQKPILFTAGSDHDPSGFPRFENDDYLVGFGPSKEAIHKVIAPSLRSFQQRRAPFLATIFNPIAKLLSNIP